MNNNISFSSLSHFRTSLKCEYPSLFGHNSILGALSFQMKKHLENMYMVYDKEEILQYLDRVERWTLNYPISHNEMQFGVVYVGTIFHYLRGQFTDEELWILFPDDETQTKTHKLPRAIPLFQIKKDGELVRWSNLSIFAHAIRFEKLCDIT